MYSINDTVDIPSAYGNKSPVWVVAGVKANDDFTLTVTFITGEKKLYDFKPVLDKFSVFERLKDVNLFKLARADIDGITWDEDLDIAAETLYVDGVPV